MPAAKSPPTTIGAVKDIVPKLAELTEKVLFGDVWARPGLSKRDRSMITCAALIALNRTEQLKGHLERALNNGVTPEEIGETLALYERLIELAVQDDPLLADLQSEIAAAGPADERDEDVA